MLDTLQKMSGTTHRSYIDSKTITTDKQRLFMQNESKLSYTMTTKEVPVIMYNDMAFIAERNSIVFRAGDAPIWNRNQTILPMSWRLFSNTIVHAGHDYSLQTIPTLSSALDFDVRKNQPDFMKMLHRRMEQAYLSQMVKERYQEAYGYSDYEIEQLDPDNYADDIMAVINEKLRQKEAQERGEMDIDDDYCEEGDWMNDVEVNKEQIEVTEKIQAENDMNDKKIYAGGLLSKNDLWSKFGVPHAYDKEIVSVYATMKGDFEHDTEHFRYDKGNLYGAEDGLLYIQAIANSEDLNKLNKYAEDEKSRMFADAKIDAKDVSEIGSYTVTDDFYRFLASQPRWSFAKGRFETAMAAKLNT